MDNLDELERRWGRAFVHESGHAIIAISRGIPCFGIYYDKTKQQFCTANDLPESETEYTKDHFLMLVAGSAGELVMYGTSNEAAAEDDRKPFKNAGAPSLESTQDEAHATLSKNKRKIRRLVSMMKEKLRQVGLNVEALPEKTLDGSNHKFGLLLSGEEVENALKRG
jgi:hypothetical protein